MKYHMRMSPRPLDIACRKRNAIASIPEAEFRTQPELARCARCSAALDKRDLAAARRRQST